MTVHIIESVERMMGETALLRCFGGEITADGEENRGLWGAKLKIKLHDALHSAKFTKSWRNKIKKKMAPKRRNTITATQ